MNLQMHLVIVAFYKKDAAFMPEVALLIST